MRHIHIHTHTHTLTHIHTYTHTHTCTLKNSLANRAGDGVAGAVLLLEDADGACGAAVHVLLNVDHARHTSMCGRAALEAKRLAALPAPQKLARRHVWGAHHGAPAPGLWAEAHEGVALKDIHERKLFKSLKQVRVLWAQHSLYNLVRHGMVARKAGGEGMVRWRSV